jgi:hypothetical protein
MSKHLCISQHAHDRCRQRLGLNAKATKRTAQKAFEKGLSHEDCTGALKGFCERLFLAAQSAKNIRFYGEHAWIFVGEKLVTVYLVPNNLKPHLRRAFKERDAKG